MRLSISLVFVLFCLSLDCLGQVNNVLDSRLNAVKHDLKKDSASMSFEIQTQTAKSSRNNVTVNLIFKNQSDKTVRLLDLFDPAEVFFGLRITVIGGKSFAPLLGGFIDFPHGMKLQYIEIKPNRSFVKELNISAILKAQNIVLERSRYKLEMSYFNYRGEDCIKGRFKSNAIELAIAN